MNGRRRACAGAAVGVVLLVGTAVLVGCGGGGTSSTPVSGDKTGNLVIKFDLPTASRDGRYIPPEAKSIKASIYPAGDLGTVQASAFVNLPASSIAFTGVGVGPKDIRLWAYGGTDATGSIRAYGICQATVQWGQENLGHCYLEHIRLFFVSSRDGNAELYRATLDGLAYTRVTNNTYPDTDPAASPDGTRIAFASCPLGGDYRINVRDNTSGVVTELADSVGDDRFPSWSPDSKKVAWVNYNAGTYSLKLMNADASGIITTLAVGAGSIGRLSWSPDGTRIALAENTGPATDPEIKIFRSNLNGQFWVITDDAIWEQDPVWSFDGSSIYIVANEGFGNQLARLHSDTGFWPPDTFYPEFLTNEPWDHWLWDISPDGNLLAYYAQSWSVESAPVKARVVMDQQGGPEIYFLDIGDDSPGMGSLHQSIRVTYNDYWDGQPCFVPPTTGAGTVGGE